MPTTHVIYTLIMTLFVPSTDEGWARANVFVLDTGLTAEDCIEHLEAYLPDNGDPNDGFLPPGWVPSCTLAYDF